MPSLFLADVQKLCRRTFSSSFDISSIGFENLVPPGPRSHSVTKVKFFVAFRSHECALFMFDIFLQLLRTFALIVSAHPYCAHKSTCHVMHRARGPSTKMNKDRGDGHCYSSDLGSSVTPTFLFKKQILFTIISTLSKNKQKNHCGKLKKFQDFCSTGHGILPSFGGTLPVDEIRLIGPFKPYLAENTAFQNSNCNILGLAATVVFFANFRFGCSSGHVLSKTMSLTPMFFFSSDIARSSSFRKKNFRFGCSSGHVLFRFGCSSGHVLSKTMSLTPHFFSVLTSLVHHFQKKINVRKISRERPQGKLNGYIPLNILIPNFMAFMLLLGWYCPLSFVWAYPH